jgi:hypothetical protein
MSKLITWNVYSAEGGYIGQTEAYFATTALSRCMAVKGRLIEESAVTTEHIDDESFLLEHQAEKFILRTLRLGA